MEEYIFDEKFKIKAMCDCIQFETKDAIYSIASYDSLYQIAEMIKDTADEIFAYVNTFNNKKNICPSREQYGFGITSTK